MTHGITMFTHILTLKQSVALLSLLEQDTHDIGQDKLGYMMYLLRSQCIFLVHITIRKMSALYIGHDSYMYICCICKK